MGTISILIQVGRWASAGLLAGDLILVNSGGSEDEVIVRQIMRQKSYGESL